MRFTLELVDGPEIEPITLAEMKSNLRASDAVTALDGDITDLITGAREWVEDYTSRVLIDQTWRLTIYGAFGASGGGDTVYGHRGPGPVNHGYYCGAWNWSNFRQIPLRRAPVIAVTHFATVDAAGVETEIDADVYEVREPASKRPRIVALDGATWSAWTSEDIRITYRAGYANRLGSPQQDASVVPVRFKQAMKLWAQAHYDRGDDMGALLKAAEQCVDSLCIDMQIA